MKIRRSLSAALFAVLVLLAACLETQSPAKSARAAAPVLIPAH